MTHSREQAKTIFLQALELPTGERAAYVDAQCAQDEALHREVIDLLQHHGLVSDAFLAADRPIPAVTGDWSSERPGTRIGDYKLLEQIGEGGMGEVWVADQLEPIRRRVAVKVIKAGMDSRMVLARFEAERQALALMDHPNIAKVLDAGTTEYGRPYFALELVKGTPITQFCDARKLSPRERLELFIPVCQAIQHAHQKGIIHRDIKPSNVLVALHDEKPVPKVIDFGVAKAIGHQLTEKTLYTGFGALIGTPAYMAPEQATFNQLDVDTRADVYALGVMLYELLAGSPPFEPERLKEAALDEILRLVREEEPHKPSARLSTSKTRATIAAVRQSDPDKLTKLVRGDLDWIVMKCLEKDRTRRYETANGLAMDLQRYLRDEPVLACPPSTAYRLRKLLRRNKGTVVAAGVILLALVAGIVGTTWGMIDASRAKVVAEDEAGQKQIALDDKEKALDALTLSERAKSEQLHESLLAQARVNWLSGRPGQRFESLDVIGRATELARSLNLPPERFLDLRNAAIAALALPDLHLSGPKIDCPPDTVGFDFDEAHHTVAIVDRHGACSIRRFADGAEIHRLPPGKSEARCRLSRDGRFVAVLRVGSKHSEVVTVEVWKLDGPEPRRLLAEEPAQSANFDRQCKRVAIGYENGAIEVFDLSDGRRLHRLEPDTLSFGVIPALHPTEPLVAVCSYWSGDVVQLRDLQSGKVLASAKQGSRPLSIAWHPDGKTLAVGLAEGMLIRLYDRQLKSPPRTLVPHNAVSHLEFNRAGDRLVTSGWNGRNELFDVDTGQKLFTAATKTNTPSFNAEGDRLAGAIEDNRIAIWKVGDGREFRTLIRRGAPEGTSYGSVSIHPEGRLLAASMTDGVGIWDLDSGRELGFVATGAPHNRVFFESSGSLLTYCPAGLFRWPVRADANSPGAFVVGPPTSLGLPPGSDLGCSNDSSVIATCSRTAGTTHRFAGGWIRREDRPGHPIRFDAGADIGWIAVSPNGEWVATVGFQSGAVKVWDARDGKLVKQLVDWGATNAQFSPDGRWLSINVDGGRLFEVGTWTPGPRIRARVFSPDGQIAAGEKPDGRLRLVHVPSGKEVSTLELPTRGQTGAPAFTMDGSKLVGCDTTAKGIHVWDLRLIHNRLKSMGLDWDWPTFDGAGPSSALPITVRFLGEIELITSDMWSERASTHFQAREWDKAVAAYSKAIELQPYNALTWNNRGSAYSWMNQWDKALNDHTEAIARMPSNPFYWSSRANAFAQLEQYDKAVADYSKAIELSPIDERFWTKRGNVYATLSEWEKAAADFERATTLAPDDAYTRYLLALARLRAGDRSSSEKVCAGMLERFGDSKDSTAAYWTAWTHTIAGSSTADWKPLVRLAEIALEAEPTSFDRMSVLGGVLYRAGEYDEAAKRLTVAETAFLRTKDARGTIVYTWLYLAITEYRRGHVSAAVNCLQKAQTEIDKPTRPRDPAEKNWNRRLTLQLLRAEAESLIRQAVRGPAPREIK